MSLALRGCSQRCFWFGGGKGVAARTLARGRVFHFALNDTGEPLVEGGEGLGGEGTWSRGGGLPFVGDADEATCGVLGGLCCNDLRKFNQ